MNTLARQPLLQTLDLFFSLTDERKSWPVELPSHCQRRFRVALQSCDFSAHTGEGRERKCYNSNVAVGCTETYFHCGAVSMSQQYCSKHRAVFQGSGVTVCKDRNLKMK